MITDASLQAGLLDQRCRCEVVDGCDSHLWKLQRIEESPTRFLTCVNAWNGRFCGHSLRGTPRGGRSMRLSAQPGRVLFVHLRLSPAHPKLDTLVVTLTTDSWINKTSIGSSLTD